MKSIMLCVFFVQAAKCEFHLQTRHVKVAADFVFIVRSHQDLASSVDGHKFFLEVSWRAPEPEAQLVYALVPFLCGQKLKSPVKRSTAIASTNQGIAWPRNQSRMSLVARY